ncbi:12502_t:CDS:2 [Ambispora gerdemannii]|uniref:12502_t:CDS:1 n=1 Tax=Ambispora gerdemannii TaxID=144530 RepID=A0A9N9CXZ3_9GLOM|nr:12502_t:CDS:2 [Ambispora gerdemannii]
MAHTKSSKHSSSNSNSNTYTSNSNLSGGGGGNGNNSNNINNTNSGNNERNERSDRIGSGGSAGGSNNNNNNNGGSGGNSGANLSNSGTSSRQTAAGVRGYTREKESGASSSAVATVPTSISGSFPSTSHYPTKRIQKGKEPVKEIPAFDFNTLDISVLRRYRRIYKLKIAEPATKETLVREITKHYQMLKPVENDVISQFLYNVHNRDNVLKLPIP